MRSAIGNVLKFVGGVSSSKLNSPPKSCIPSNAKIRINRKRRNNKEIIERIEFNKEITRFRNDDQYLVTLNILSNLKALSTDNPKEPSLYSDQITSNIDPLITTQSKRLNADAK